MSDDPAGLGREPPRSSDELGPSTVSPARAAGPNGNGWLTWRAWLVALIATLIAVIITLVVSRSGDASHFALTRDPHAMGDVDLSFERDAAGRLTRVVPHGDGNQLLFHAGHLTRIESHRDGQVDGAVLEFNDAGGLVGLRTYERGVERGPWIELDGHGLVTASGTR